MRQSITRIKSSNVLILVNITNEKHKDFDFYKKEPYTYIVN